MAGILDDLPTTSLLADIPGGGVLDMPKRRENQPRAACRRCGCWVSARRAIEGPDGLLWCPTCCGGRQPVPTPA